MALVVGTSYFTACLGSGSSLWRALKKAINPAKREAAPAIPGHGLLERSVAGADDCGGTRTSLTGPADELELDEHQEDA
jgi:hypothetical protein